ncbi:uncharacterized protein LOC142741226 [Rhinoderma darwinii]|uniref:uncharacterized protein LOC142741226 n=1 Tax=Rhinoderma darwinii TaxID=43563 RepID=UPI003F670050
MPTCWVSGCWFTPGRFHNEHELKLHCFPNSLAKIIEWLQHMGQEFENIELLAEKIFAGKKHKRNKYRLCSLHFTDDSFIVNATGRVLRQNAVPTLFKNSSNSSTIVDESLSRKKITKRRTATSENPNQEFVLEAMSTPDNNTTTSFSTPHASSSTSRENNPSETLMIAGLKSFRDVETQTDFNIGNSVILSNEEYYSIINKGNVQQTQITKVLHSTPFHLHQAADFSTEGRENVEPFPSPIQSVQLPCENLTELEDLEEDKVSGVFPFTVDSLEEESNHASCVVYEDDGAVYNPKDASYNPFLVSECSLQNTAMRSINESLVDSSSFLYCVDSATMLDQNKFIVFENCLDVLIRKVKCQEKDGCPFTVTTIVKERKRSTFIIRGRCKQGHNSLLWNTQPNTGRFYSGNILLASSILCSGLNLHKVAELSKILRLEIFSEKTFYRYQSSFIFPAIQIAWLEEQNKLKNQLSTIPICLAGDGQCDSPGHSAKYCTYTVMDLFTEKIMDFEVVQRSQCTSSVAMEKFGFL